MNLPENLDEAVKAMLTCNQMEGLTVYQHGKMVRDHLFELISHMKDGCEIEGWRIPKWIEDYKEEILENLHDDEILANYTLFHDIGKPYCRTVDEDGRVHFPDHANVSQKIWNSISNDETVGKLIANDMVIHTSSAEEIQSLIEGSWSIKDAITLLTTALCEIHANSKMFGGTSSSSFKGKWKKIDRRGRQICKFYFGELALK